jgi:hypothetical protein
MFIEIFYTFLRWIEKINNLLQKATFKYKNVLNKGFLAYLLDLPTVEVAYFQNLKSFYTFDTKKILELYGILEDRGIFYAFLGFVLQGKNGLTHAYEHQICAAEHFIQDLCINESYDLKNFILTWNDPVYEISSSPARDQLFHKDHMIFYLWIMNKSVLKNLKLPVEDAILNKLLGKVKDYIVANLVASEILKKCSEHTLLTTFPIIYQILFFSPQAYSTEGIFDSLKHYGWNQ